MRDGNLRNGSDALAMSSAIQSGGTCKLIPTQIICFGVSKLYSPVLSPYEMAVPDGRPMTIGDVVVYSGTEQEWNDRVEGEKQQRAQMTQQYGADIAGKYGPDIIRHEAVHSDQWAASPNVRTYVAAYAAWAGVSYLRTGSEVLGNPFEQKANLYWGGYLTYVHPQPPSGPVPNPSPAGWS